MVSSQPTQLDDLPDALLLTICTDADLGTQHRLLGVCRRWRRLCRLPLWLRRLCGRYLDFPPKAQHTAAIIKDLVVLAKCNPDVVPVVQNRLDLHHIVRIVDQIVRHGSLAKIYSDFFRIFQLKKYFQLIAPGVYLEMRQHSGRVRAPINVPRYLKIFGVPLSEESIDLRADEKIFEFIEEFFQLTANQKRYCPRPDIVNTQWASIFTWDVLQLGFRFVSSMFLGGSFTAWLLKRIPECDKHLLTDPIVLFMLVRIGVRFAASEYVDAIQVSPEQFDEVAPFLVHRRHWSLQPATVLKLVRAGRGDILRFLQQAPDHDDYCLKGILVDLLKERDYDAFRTMFLSIHDFLYPGFVLDAAFRSDAPRDILDLVLDKSRDLNRLYIHCPYKDLRRYIKRKMDAMSDSNSENVPSNQQSCDMSDSDSDNDESNQQSCDMCDPNSKNVERNQHSDDEAPQAESHQNVRPKKKLCT